MYARRVRLLRLTVLLLLSINPGTAASRRISSSWWSSLMVCSTHAAILSQVSVKHAFTQSDAGSTRSRSRAFQFLLLLPVRISNPTSFAHVYLVSGSLKELLLPLLALTASLSLSHQQQRSRSSCHILTFSISNSATSPRYLLS